MDKSGKLLVDPYHKFVLCVCVGTYVVISEMYNLKYRNDDTEKMRYFLDIDRKEFINHVDTLVHFVDRKKYVVQWIGEGISDELKKKVLAAYHKGNFKKVGFDE